MATSSTSCVSTPTYQDAPRHSANSLSRLYMKRSLGGAGALKADDRLELVDHPLRVEARSQLCVKTPLCAAKLCRTHARNTADIIACHILQARCSHSNHNHLACLPVLTNGTPRKKLKELPTEVLVLVQVGIPVSGPQSRACL